MTELKKVPYGLSHFTIQLELGFWSNFCFSVRLGNSGLKVSKIILGAMSYGDKRWQEWVLEENEAIEHFKFASVMSLKRRISMNLTF